MKKIYIILAIILVVGLIGLKYSFNFSTVSQVDKLDCSNYDECIQMLKANGMPDNYLEENHIIIRCNGGVCYAEK